jgi:predicted GH43/DUF377 family glycosyl hydrolase
MATERASFGSGLFRRSDANPILTAADWPYSVNSVFNAGAVRLPSGQTLLLARTEDMRGISHLCAARSDDGVTGWQIDREPTLPADPEHHPEECWGIEDPRITYAPGLGQYAVTYTCFSVGGPGVSLALTRDFRSFERIGVIQTPDNKDAALFPRRFGGRWALLHRPSAPDRLAHIWISFSPDLRHWGDARILVEARRGAWWDASKVGTATPPLETERGWLLLYHGVRTTAAGALYRLGAALLDLEDPTRVLLRSEEWIFGPSEPYERMGDVPDVVFPCGAVMAGDGQTLRVYYGAADTSICLATVGLKEMLDWLEETGSPEQVTNRFG